MGVVAFFGNYSKGNTTIHIKGIQHIPNTLNI